VEESKELARARRLGGGGGGREGFSEFGGRTTDRLSQKRTYWRRPL